MRKSVIGTATLALLASTALVSAQQPERNQGGSPPAAKEQTQPQSGADKGSEAGRTTGGGKAGESRSQTGDKGKSTAQDKSEPAQDRKGSARGQTDQGKSMAQDKSEPAQDRKGSAQGQTDQGKDRTAEPKDKAGDTKRTADPKDKAGDTKRTADPKDKAGDTKRTADPKDKAGDRDRDQARQGKDGDRDRDRARQGKDGDRDRDQARQGKDGDRDRDEARQGKDGDRDRDQARGKDDRRDGDRVTLTQNQRTEVREKLSRHREARVNNVNFSINVGTRVPRDFRLSVVPADIVSIVPAYRGYRYFIVEERVVIVHPTRYEIVEVIEVDGPRRGGPVTASIELSQPQIELILDRVPMDRHRADVRIDLALGAEVPSSVELYEFPDEVVAEIPALRSHRYVVVDNRVVVVDPSGRDVIRVIDR